MYSQRKLVLCKGQQKILRAFTELVKARKNYKVFQHLLVITETTESTDKKLDIINYVTEPYQQSPFRVGEVQQVSLMAAAQSTSMVFPQAHLDPRELPPVYPTINKICTNCFPFDLLSPNGYSHVGYEKRLGFKTNIPNHSKAFLSYRSAGHWAVAPSSDIFSISTHVLCWMNSAEKRLSFKREQSYIITIKL